jgi:diguanylate cyclase (GGDEF)-like protein
LRRELQYDPLTKLFNQIATKNLVESILVRNPIDRHMMFIIDIDNFKQANDQYGHLFGNSVLVEIAKTLRQVFRQEDLIGRIGGDEFLVFLNHLHNEDEAVRLAQQLTHRLHQAVIQPHQDYTISLSIGFSTYPDNGTSYEELFTAADFALYRSKRRGKDRIEGAIPPKDATS